MKSKIHPEYYKEAKVACACGNTFTTGSTLPEITLDICSACHPFFTGEMRLIDTQGRIEKFEARRAKAGKSTTKKKAKISKQERPKSLKEMLHTKEEVSQEASQK